MAGEAAGGAGRRVAEGWLRDEALLKPQVVCDGVWQLWVEAGQKLQGGFREEHRVIVTIQQPLVGVTKHLQSAYRSYELSHLGIS